MRRLLVLAAALLALAHAPPAAAARAAPPAFSLHALRLVDRSRELRLRDGRWVPRTLVTYVRVPRGAGPFPLVVFGHGFSLLPATYTRLLNAWAAAGFVVAAPVFPLENANAPGGPDESDLINQPADMRFVITRLLAGPLRGAIDPARIAVAGHSDGGETALAVAFDARFRDPRVRAAVILSGSALPGGRLVGGAALLAVQGTADRVNPPGATRAFYDAAPRPKFLLELLGAQHEPPYTDEQPQLGVVERTSIAFLRHFLEGRPLARLSAAARAPGVAVLSAAP